MQIIEIEISQSVKVRFRVLTEILMAFLEHDKFTEQVRN